MAVVSNVVSLVTVKPRVRAHSALKSKIEFLLIKQNCHDDHWF